MARKKEEKNLKILNFGALLFAILTVVSIFLVFIKTTPILGASVETSGYDILKDLDNTLRNYSDFTKVAYIATLGAAVVIAALSILRLIGLFDGKFFSLIFVLLGIICIVGAIISFVNLPKIDFGIASTTLEKGIGLILFLIGGIVTALCTIGSFLSGNN